MRKNVVIKGDPDLLVEIVEFVKGEYEFDLDKISENWNGGRSTRICDDKPWVSFYPGSDTISVDLTTAWCQPTEELKCLSSIFPSVEIKNNWNIFDLGLKGQDVYLNGEEISTTSEEYNQRQEQIYQVYCENYDMSPEPLVIGYINNYRGIDSSADIDDLWDSRILVNGFELLNWTAAQKYIEKYKKITISDCMQLALKADSEGYIKTALGFWIKAYELETGNDALSFD